MMLKYIKDNVMNTVCNICGHEKEIDITNMTSKFLPEFGQYENIVITCENCNGIEIFNMNIPVDDIDEPFKTGDLPTDEEVQRYYIRILMRQVREDFKNATK